MQMIIDGKFVGSVKTFDVVNPYNKQIVDKVPIASEKQIDEALRLSFKEKNDLKGDERAAILNESAKIIKKRKDEIARLITSESGLCIKQTHHEVERTLDVLKESAKLASSIDRQDFTKKFLRDDQKSKPILKVISEPLDLVIGITPFNHPLNQVAHKVCPAIAAGAKMVLKPSEKTPLTALLFGKILLESGLPKNMVNIITGYPPKYIVDKMISNPLVEMVSFTGGIEVGKYISRKMNESGNELKKYVAELGGNSALTVLEDADLDLAAKIAMGSFDNSGQRCTAIKRILVDKKIVEDFIDKFLSNTEKLKYGDSMDPKNDMGTVINEEAAILIQKRIEMAIKDGAKLLLGNERDGALYSPTILDRVNPRSELVVKETFGPVGPIIRINGLKDAIKIIKFSRYRLAGAVITKDSKKARELSNNIKVGQFNWNGPPGYRSEHAPFGGFPDSGNYEKEGVILAIESMRRMRTFYTHH